MTQFQKNTGVLPNLKEFEDQIMRDFVAFANRSSLLKDSSFSIDPDNRGVFTTLFNSIALNWYVDMGEDLLARKISQKRGFLIIGDIGLGKSTLMRLFKEYQTSNHRPSFGIYTAKQISDYYKSEGNIDRFLDKTTTFKQYPRICVDELGREDSKVNNFGTSTNVISNLMQERYSLWQTYGVVTHYITNLNLEEIKTVYGEFLLSRLIEQCNILVFKGKNMRR